MITGNGQIVVLTAEDRSVGAVGNITLITFFFNTIFTESTTSGGGSVELNIGVAAHCSVVDGGKTGNSEAVVQGMSAVNGQVVVLTAHDLCCSFVSDITGIGVENLTVGLIGGDIAFEGQGRRSGHHSVESRSAFDGNGAVAKRVITGDVQIVVGTGKHGGGSSGITDLTAGHISLGGTGGIHFKCDIAVSGNFLVDLKRSCASENSTSGIFDNIGINVAGDIVDGKGIDRDSTACKIKSTAVDLDFFSGDAAGAGLRSDTGN